MKIASTAARDELTGVRQRELGGTELSHRDFAKRRRNLPSWLSSTTELFEGHLYDLAFMLDKHLTPVEVAATRDVMFDIYPSFSINGITYNSRRHGPIIGVSSAVFWMILLDSLALMAFEALRRALPMGSPEQSIDTFREVARWAKEVMRLARSLQRGIPESLPGWPTLPADLQERLPGLFQHQFLFIVAHELGHVIHGHHVSPDSHEFSWRDELDADAFAAELLLRLDSDRPGVQSTLDILFGKLRALDAAVVGMDRIRASKTTHPPPGIRRISLAYRKQLAPIAYSAFVEVLALYDLKDKAD